MTAATATERHSGVFAPPADEIDGRRNLVGMTQAEMAEALGELGYPAFRAKQLFHWVYHQGVTEFAEMTNLAKDFRGELGKHFVVARPAIDVDQRSTDGTRKWLLKCHDGQQVECVHIPETEKGRGTLCVSSQVGCTLTCTFCHTGTQRLVRNLSSAEIAGQVMLARDCLDGWPSPKEDRQLTNIVMMGMGEPLYNFENVKKALQIVMDPAGITIGRRKITLSTSGVVPMMRRCGEELGVNLAVSLHAVTDEIRDEIVPLNRKYPLAELLQACREYPGAHNARRITFEYVMLKGVNDSEADARELARLLKDMPAKVNLIPFNPWPGTVYECSDWDAIERFSDILYEYNLSAPIRRPRGRDISAACGQLKSASERKRKSEREAAPETAPEA